MGGRIRATAHPVPFPDPTSSPKRSCARGGVGRSDHSPESSRASRARAARLPAQFRRERSVSARGMCGGHGPIAPDADYPSTEFSLVRKPDNQPRRAVALRRLYRRSTGAAAGVRALCSSGRHGTSTCPRAGRHRPDVPRLQSGAVLRRILLPSLSPAHRDGAVSPQRSAQSPGASQADVIRFDDASGTVRSAYPITDARARRPVDVSALGDDSVLRVLHAVLRADGVFVSGAADSHRRLHGHCDRALPVRDHSRRAPPAVRIVLEATHRTPMAGQCGGGSTDSIRRITPTTSAISTWRGSSACRSRIWCSAPTGSPIRCSSTARPATKATARRLMPATALADLLAGSRGVQATAMDVEGQLRSRSVNPSGKLVRCG